MPEPAVAVDFETFYDKKIYSVAQMSTWNYTRDRRFDAYLVAVHGNGVHYVGHPKDFNWETIAGMRWVAHNAGFDGLVYSRLQEQGIVPADIQPKEWFCTADMAAYFHVARNLQNSCKFLLNRDISKVVRTQMSGLTYADAVAKGLLPKLLEYGGSDAVNEYDLYTTCADKWPQVEQDLSAEIRACNWAGIPLNRELLGQSFETISEQREDALRALPWYPDEEPLARSAAGKQARMDGLDDMPVSLAMTSPDANAWIARNEDKFPWVRAVRDYRRINTLYLRIKALTAGIREDNTFPMEIMYFGAGKTGRDSGGATDSERDTDKFNMLNMPKYSMFGVNVRPHFVAPPGCALLIIDHAQIEARYLLWRVGDFRLFDKLRGGLNLYEAGSEVYSGVKDGRGLKKNDPLRYHAVKGQILGCGYQMGGDRFFMTAPLLTNGKYKPTKDEAFAAVRVWREHNPKVVNYWYGHQNRIIQAARMREDSYNVELASGRWLYYYKPRMIMVEDEKTKKQRAEVYAYPILGREPNRIFGGKVTENEVQASCRDILRDARLKLAKAGLRAYYTTYDEYVIPVSIKSAKEAAAEAVDIIRSASPWCHGLPLDFDVELSPFYPSKEG